MHSQCEGYVHFELAQPRPVPHCVLLFRPQQVSFPLFLSTVNGVSLKHLCHLFYYSFARWSSCIRPCVLGGGGLCLVCLSNTVPAILLVLSKHETSVHVFAVTLTAQNLRIHHEEAMPWVGNSGNLRNPDYPFWAVPTLTSCLCPACLQPID